MATKKDNISEASIELQARQNEKSAELARRQLAKDFREMEKVYVKIPPLYKPYFGKVLPIAINGIEIAIPVDGKAYLVPKAYANRAKILMSNQDDLFERGKKMSDIQNNVESTPGELTIF